MIYYQRGPGQAAARSALVIGVDAGGSGMRAVVADSASGAVSAVRGSAQGGAGNAVSVARTELAARLVQCLRDCLDVAGVASDDVAAVAVGLAGLRANPDAADTVRQAVQEAGLRCPVDVRSDIEAAFAAGSARPEGVVLIAGTGAVAARLREFRVAATADGAGWLLGDEGGGFWIARRALREVLAALDGRGPETALTSALCAALGVEPSGPELVASAMSAPPPQLAALAPHVFVAASDGDAVAAAIVDDAVRCLTGTVAALRPVAGETLVLAGGLIGPDAPLSNQVRDALQKPGGPPVELAANNALGAAKLAAKHLAENKF